MNITRLRPGDAVECNVRGRVFVASVVSAEYGQVQLDPPRGITYYTIPARCVVKRVGRAGFDPRTTQRG